MQNTEIYKIKKIFIESRLNLFGNILFVILINSNIERTPKRIRQYIRKKLDIKIKNTPQSKTREVKILFFRFFDIIYYRNFFLYFYTF